MARKPRTKAPAPEAEAPDTSSDFDPALLEAQPATEAEPSHPPVHTEPREEHPADEPRGDHPRVLLPGRDWSKFADPARRQSVEFEDGYRISVQESPSRKTVEIQFGDGSSKDKPENYDAIRQTLREEGMKWNGSNAWVVDLAPAPQHRHESEAEKIDRQRHNARIRAHVEDVVFPRVVALEEAKRGLVKSDVIRERINQLSAGQGR